MSISTMSQIMTLALLVVILATSQAYTCTSDIDCSLNGVCNSGACACDKPWKGDSCGVLSYKVTPASGKDLYPLNNTGPRVQPTPALNTWNGPIVGPVDGKYHLYDPLYAQGSLLKATAVMHGTADVIEGPYDWNHPPIQGGSNPAFVTYNDTTTGKTKYTLWVSGMVHIADTPDGPFVVIPNSHYPGGNPAPLYHEGVWYMTYQQTHQVYTTPALDTPWRLFSNITVPVPSGMRPEDPFMYIDTRSNWHIINHAYDTAEYSNCGSSTLSAHTYSPDGKNWHMLVPNVEPYTHTVQYDDGTSHTYTTLERPNLHFNAMKQLTHINLAADMVAQNEGCANYTQCPARQNGHCACTNCKYADHAGTIIIALDA